MDTSLIPVPPTPQPQEVVEFEAGYYRLVKKWKPWSEVIEPGGLWFLISYRPEDNTVKLVQGDGSCRISVDIFQKKFAFAPEGAAERQADMVKLMQGLHEFQSNQSSLLVESVPNLPRLTANGEESNNDQMTVIDERTTGVVNRTKAQIRTVKSSMMRAALLMERQTKELQKLVNEQATILKEQAKELTTKIEFANEIIYMLNTYLGADEKLIRIKNGPKAPAETPIVMRQLVLYMDEEIAAAADWASSNDFDFQDITSFDEWICEPKNLQQVLPETKGIVAIKPCRYERRYGDPLYDAELNKLNKTVYILVRNGDLLYRIFTTMDLGKVFFPRRNEYEKLFTKSDYDTRLGKHVDKPIYPGDHDYKEAMKKATKLQRRFYTVLLLIQGILDRTKIFQPLPPKRINVCELHTTGSAFQQIHDAEMLLGDGRPPFDDWLNGLNNELDVGSRIVGAFSCSQGSAFHYSEKDYGDRRVRPRRATRPKSGVIHVLEGKEDGMFVFRYARDGETVYSGWYDRGHEPVRRASCRISKTDKVIINYDAVKIEDIEYYMSSRLHRHNYSYMLPTLQKVVEAKKQEAAEEEPFRKLLVGQIMKAHKVSFGAAMEQIDSLVDWWKLKNKIRRSLKSDDAKAIRMIVKEFGDRHELAQTIETEKANDQRMVEIIRSQRADCLAIFRHPEGHYVVFRWHNDDPHFVCEEKWYANPGVCTEASDWKIPGSYHMSWLSLWQHERWTEWRVNIREDEVLTDVEKDQAVNYGIQRLKSESFIPEKMKGRRVWLAPLAAKWAPDKKAVMLYYVSTHSVIPKKKLLTSPAFPPCLGTLQIHWKREKGQLVFYDQYNRLYERRWTGEDQFRIDPEHAPWGSNFERAARAGKATGKVLKMFPVTIARVEEENAAFEVFEKLGEELGAPAEAATRQISKILSAQWYTAQKAEFDEEYEDFDGLLWEAHKEKIKEKKPSYWFGWLNKAIEHLLDANQGFVGLTVADVVTKAKKYGYEPNERYKEDLAAVKDIVFVNPVIKPHKESKRKEDADDFDDV